MAASPPLALVTGGMRRMGAHIAARLAAAGYELALHCHRAAEPEEPLASALAGLRWQAFPAELEAPGAAAALLDAVAGAFGRLPALIVGNASMFDAGDGDAIGEAALMAHLRVNMAVPVLLADGLARRLPEGGQRAVVQVLDQRIANPPVDQLAYTLSKQALAASIRSTARALAPRVRVNGVAPGLTLPTPDYGAAQWQRLGARMPLGALPMAGEVADAVLFLAQARSVTGQTLFVDGGAHLESWRRDFVHMERD